MTNEMTFRERAMIPAMTAHIESVARDCDGMHYRDNDYMMEDSERLSQFGDLEFYSRIVSYIVNTGAISGRLNVFQSEGLPVLEWSESTEEGFHSERVTFTQSAP